MTDTCFPWRDRHTRTHTQIEGGFVMSDISYLMLTCFVKTIPTEIRWHRFGKIRDEICQNQTNTDKQHLHAAFTLRFWCTYRFTYELWTSSSFLLLSCDKMKNWFACVYTLTCKRVTQKTKHEAFSKWKWTKLSTLTRWNDIWRRSVRLEEGKEVRCQVRLYLTYLIREFRHREKVTANIQGRKGSVEEVERDWECRGNVKERGRKKGKGSQNRWEPWIQISWDVREFYSSYCLSLALYVCVCDHNFFPWCVCFKLK